MGGRFSIALLVAVAMFCGVVNSSAEARVPKATDVADHFIATNKPESLDWNWGPAVFLYALTRFGDRYADYVERYHEHHAKHPTIIDFADHCPSALSALWLQTHAKSWTGMTAAADVANYLKTEPRNSIGSLDHVGRRSVAAKIYADSIWVDSLMMWALFAVQWGAKFSEPELLEFGVNQPLIFAKHLQDEKSGLFRHAYFIKKGRAVPKEEAYWLRGNGWVATSIVEILEALPPGAYERQRQALLEVYRKLVAGLLRYQRANGLWDTIVNEPGQSYVELSGSALAAYAIARGANRGYLPKSAIEKARHAHSAILRRLKKTATGYSMPGISWYTIPGPKVAYTLVPRKSDLPYGVGALLLLESELGEEKLVDFSAVPPAQSIEESKERFDARSGAVFDYWKGRALGEFRRENAVEFQSAAFAKLWAKYDVESVNLALLSPEARVYAAVGTNFDFLGPLCRRRGDYDFMAQGLVRLLYHFKDRPELLWPEARAKLASELLSINGPVPKTTLKLGACGRQAETENHILMTESSRYLMNQYRDGENHAGYEQWLLTHLQQFLRKDFSEYNAKPYQGYSIMALQNLYDFADSKSVKLGAQMVLDYLAAKFAVQSSGLRRVAPFKRQREYRLRTEMFAGDAEAARYALLVGNFEDYAALERPYRPEYGAHFMAAAAASRYRVPDVIADLMISKDRLSYFQKFRHEGVEIYHSTPEFLISAGGIFVDRYDWGTGHNDGWAMPTTLMLHSSDAIDRRELLRIEGHKEKTRRNNTCVAKFFACGLNLVMPEALNARAQLIRGNWAFYDLGEVYVTVYRKKQKEQFGFFEVYPKTGAQTFESYAREVLRRNGKRRYSLRGTSSFKTSKGDEIEFTVAPRSRSQWAIRRINGQAVETEFGRWKLAEGDIVNADGSGLVEISNPRLGAKLVLDWKNPKEPRRDAF